MKSRHLISAALAAAALAGASAASAATTPERDCFYSRNVNGFSAVDDSTINLRVGVRDVYQLNLFQPSHDLDFALGIGLESRGSTFICSGLDATLIVPSTIGPQRYPVTSIRKLSANEVAALPKKQRP